MKSHPLSFPVGYPESYCFHPILDLDSHFVSMEITSKDHVVILNFMCVRETHRNMLCIAVSSVLGYISVLCYLVGLLPLTDLLLCNSACQVEFDTQVWTESGHTY